MSKSIVENTAWAVTRFVRGAQGMTHDERAWFFDRIVPLIITALEEERAEIIASIPGGDVCDPQIVCDLIRARNSIEMG